MEMFTFIIFLIVAYFIYASLNKKITDLRYKVDSLLKNVSNTAPIKMNDIPKVVVQDEPDASVAISLNNDSSNIKMDVKVSDEEKSGKFLGKIGVVAILLAGAFFLKDVPDEGKIIIGIIVGMVFIGLGFYLKTKYKTYSHLLMGGGVAVLYLTVFAATNVFSMIDSSFGFLLMVLITAISIVMSIYEDAIGLAVLGSFGGFLTPILISSGENNYPALFSYLLILDLGILAISFKKRWLSLYHVGFWGTIMIFFVWSAKYYDEKLLSHVMVFLTLCFLIFLLASIFHHFVRKERTTMPDIFGILSNTILYFIMSVSLLYTQYSDNLGYFSFALALIYSIMSYVSFKTKVDDKILNYTLAGISVVFLSITMPLQFTGKWITVAWLIEALTLYLMAFYVPHQVLKKMGAIVLALGIFRILFYDGIISSIDSPKIFVSAFTNFGFILLLMVVAISYLVYNLYKKFENNQDVNIKGAMAAIILTANILTVVGITSQIYLYYDNGINSLNDSFYKKEEKIRMDLGNEANSSGQQDVINLLTTDTFKEVDSLRNQRNTAISVFWAIYSVLLIAIGFIRNMKLLRKIGLIFFVITAVKIFFDVWSLGTQYRVISLVVFGVVALLGSFGYAKYKQKLIN